jgi:predicted phage baseplate assembly protein
MERDGRALVRFGDNLNGRRPAIESRWRATYRVGNGSAGNIGADALAHVMVPNDGSERSSAMLFGIDVVRNPLPATGGTDPERDEQARLYAPYSFRQGERAVTADDYAKITERHPEVQKAIAQIRWTGSWDTVFVTVDRRGGLPLDAAFEIELRSYLEPFRMAGQDLEFSPPQFVPLDIALTIHVAPDYLRSEVKRALLEVMGSGETSAGKRGFFHPDNFTFGDPVYLSRIVATAMKVPGVVWVDIDDSDGKPNRFQRFGEDSRGEIGKGVIVVAPLEIIRVDNDPTAPHHGRIQLYMEGGL